MEFYMNEERFSELLSLPMSEEEDDLAVQKFHSEYLQRFPSQLQLVEEKWCQQNISGRKYIIYFLETVVTGTRETFIGFSNSKKARKMACFKANQRFEQVVDAIAVSKYCSTD